MFGGVSSWARAVDDDLRVLRGRQFWRKILNLAHRHIDGAGQMRMGVGLRRQRLHQYEFIVPVDLALQIFSTNCRAQMSSRTVATGFGY